MISAPLRCGCGKLTGTVSHLSRKLNRRFVCYCLDCQSFAHFLKQTKAMLDSNGGTEIVPVHPARITFTQGTDQLTCVRLSSDGMIRWYTRCCQTPVANTPSGRLPFAGVHAILFDFSETPNQREEVLGPIYGRVNGKNALGKLPAGTSGISPPKMILNVLLFMLRGIIGKLQNPSPFFDAQSRTPRVSPMVLPDDQYDKLITH